MTPMTASLLILTYIVCFCALYEEFRTLGLLRKGIIENQNAIRIDASNLGKPWNHMRLDYEGRITDFIYTAGVLTFAVFHHYKFVFAIILFMSLIPKRKRWIVATDSIISIALISGVILLAFCVMMIEYFPLFTSLVIKSIVYIINLF